MRFVYLYARLCGCTYRCMYLKCLSYLCMRKKNKGRVRVREKAPLFVSNNLMQRAKTVGKDESIRKLTSYLLQFAV